MLYDLDCYIHLKTNDNLTNVLQFADMSLILDLVVIFFFFWLWLYHQQKIPTSSSLQLPSPAAGDTANKRTCASETIFPAPSRKWQLFTRLILCRHRDAAACFKFYFSFTFTILWALSVFGFALLFQRSTPAVCIF